MLLSIKKKKKKQKKKQKQQQHIKPPVYITGNVM